MSRTLIEAPITTRRARAKLPQGVHWRGIDSEVHLGYRKGKRAGVWIVRWRNGRGYKQAKVGTADDGISEGTLDFDAATRRAREIVEDHRKKAALQAAGEPLTVGDVVRAYVAMRDARESKRTGREVRSDAHQRLGRYVIGQPARGRQPEIPAAPLAGIELHALRESDLIAWRSDLPGEIKTTTRQRLVNDLKAALNSAYAENRDKLDPTLPAIIKHGLKSTPDVDDAGAGCSR